MRNHMRNHRYGAAAALVAGIALFVTACGGGVTGSGGGGGSDSSGQARRRTRPTSTASACANTAPR